MKLNKSKLIQRWKELNLSKYMKDGSFCMTRAGHTRAVAYLEHCHSGVLTARAYAAGTYLGTLSHEEGMDMLKKLESLQCREKDSEMYGCSRWYFEETQIADTNGAFFITMPLLMIVMNLYGIDRETAGQMSRFYCQIAEYADGDWKCLIYPDCCVAILPLGGFGQEGETIPARSCQVVWDNDTLLVRKKCIRENRYRIYAVKDWSADGL